MKIYYFGIMKEWEYLHHFTGPIHIIIQISLLYGNLKDSLGIIHMTNGLMYSINPNIRS